MPVKANTDSMPTVSIGLREDGALCVILPGAFGHSRSPVIADKAFTAGFIRELLTAQRDASARGSAGGIATKAEPIQQQLDHAGHGSYHRGCAECEDARLTAQVGKIISEGKVHRQPPARGPGAPKILSKRDGVEITQGAEVHWAGRSHCKCGFEGSFRELAEHLSRLNPCFPRPAPDGFPHREISPQAARAARWRETTEWKGLFSADGKEEIEI